MLDRGFTEETLDKFEVGYDPHKKRITIPLRWDKLLIGICYREYPKKFWYSDGFIRDQYIYNYAPTKERIYVEGFTDCWAIDQYGLKNVSSYLGKEPSLGQVELMRRHDLIILAVDMDVAGFAGAMYIEGLLGDDVRLEIIPMPKKDADSCGKDVFLSSLNKRTSMTSFKLALLKHNPKLYEDAVKRNQKLAR
jgi:DNA primase